MNLSFTADEEAFRGEVRAFLDKNLTADLRAYASRMTSVYSTKPVALEWQRILVKQGWACPSWPVEYGGTGWSVAQRYIFDVEMARAGAPPLSPMGIGMCGPALIGHGSKAQKDALPAAHPFRRGLSGARAIRSRMPAPTSPRSPCRRSTTAMRSSATVRRSGPRTPTNRT
jgi:alkylation response protein AidB-like acyl-CoA dehydrogenase